MKLLKIFFNTFAVLQFILHQTESMAPIQSEDAQVPSCVKIKEQIKAFEGAGWSEWASSDSCSPTLGSGRFVFRKLCCEGDKYDCKTVNGGLRIYETQSEPFVITDECQKTADEVYSPWSVWSVWGDCPEGCGESTTKTIRRTRTCTRTNGGLGECLSPLTETQTQCCCLNGCPVNGGYTHWSDWSLVPCNETCEANVPLVRTRFRSCTNPVPNHGGRSCTGPSFETSLGSLDACPVDGVLSIWTAWTNPPCSVSCGASATKMRVKTRTCTPPQNGGKECTGNLNEAFQVYCGLNDCPVDGGYAAWSQWSLVPCSATCGINATTVRTRSRTCTNPVPNHGGAPCSGPSFERSSFTCGLNSCPVDGVISIWSVWSNPPCSVTCGASATKTRSRTRTCTPPQNGGEDCSGNLTETLSQNCFLCECPVDGSYAAWSQWSLVPCSATCGINATTVRTRSRTCTNPVPNHGGAPCSGPTFDTSTFTCGLNSCRVDGGYAAWSDWSLVPCSATCGINATTVRTRSRTCTNPVPNHGGAPCSGPSFERSSFTCGLNSCPVDGVISIWSVWSNPPCSVTCGASATKTSIRTRTCTPPQNGGEDCSGNLTETLSQNCFLCECPVDGSYAAWSQWSLVLCSATCGINATTVRTRSRTCTNPVPNHGGAPCSGPTFDTSTFTCGLNSCRVDGGYAAWSEWSPFPCSATCGINVTSVRTRSRTCTNPVPNHGGAPCSGPSFERSSFPCGLNSCPVDGVVSTWSVWSNAPCSVTCGVSATKTRSRTRTCTPPQNGGEDCSGDLTETLRQNCFLWECPVDGGYAAWSQWSLVPCSATCGINATTVRTRSRTCTNPVPNHGGAPCSGPSFDTSTLPCGLNSCRVDGGYAAWSEWSPFPCSETCGINVTSVRTRTRTCTNPVPNHGGAPCSGPSFERSSFPCGLNSCPVDGVVSTWTSWSNPPCSVTCGASATKTRSRTRTCTPPTNGGRDCSGDLTETLRQNCFLWECPVDGGYAAWSAWSLVPCSATCGINATTVRTRSRTCTNPVPQYGGALCQGLSFETGQVACTPEPSSGINIYKYRKLTLLQDIKQH
ncbi:A disintegrin and metalloproteinase with thrombospondin motifs adt-1-like isoform X3 [Haliotis rufescens]|uniref:A disintegrin and metalloproteinase with thrombospondin motifs adt-1-like isoform X3 n=1 Tax=Haliotis rufescens TaxID=6454 RepID=UPI00201ECCD3|nr:A disintegrin and metalloproteinase with thrombospondin motifs adt-1-like isoform X3 [Haliotis rufescens]